MNTRDESAFDRHDLSMYSGRLRAAMEYAGKNNQSALAREVGVKPQAIQYLLDPKNTASGSIHTAKIASALYVEPDWLSDGKGDWRPKSLFTPDLRPQSAAHIASDSTPYTVRLYSDTNMVRAPVVEWERLEAELYKENSEVVAARFEALPVNYKPNTKWVIVDADMPRLMLSRGDLVLIAPVSGQHECVDSKVHLFKTVAGAYFLGTFRLLSSGFEAIPDAGPALESGRHGVQVVGIKCGQIDAIYK